MENNTSKGDRAVRQAALTSDWVVLAATFATFFCMTSAYFVVSYVAEVIGHGESLAGIVFGMIGALFGGMVLFVVFLLIGMFIVRMQRQIMLGNSLQVEYSDYGWLREWANDVAADLKMPRVEVFVTQDPVINAYAFGFIKPYCIVLHSGSIRYLSRDELKVIVVHEMAHIKYYHTHASVYLQPFLLFPVIGMAAQWISGFWQRRAEFTADRLALMYIEDPELVKAALIKVHVGPDVASSMNQTARDWMQYTAERPMNRFAQTFSSHPFLVRRLSQIDSWKRRVHAAVTEEKG